MAVAEPPRQNSEGSPPRMLSVSEVAERLNYTDPSTVRVLIRTKQLPAERVEGSKEYLVNELDVEAYERKPRGRPRRISDETWAEIEHLVEVDEIPVKDVARLKGVNFVTIHRHMKRRKAPDATTDPS